MIPCHEKVECRTSPDEWPTKILGKLEFSESGEKRLLTCKASSEVKRGEKVEFSFNRKNFFSIDTHVKKQEKVHKCWFSGRISMALSLVMWSLTFQP